MLPLFHAEMNIFGISFQVRNFFQYSLFASHICIISLFKVFPNTFMSTYIFLVLVVPQFINSVLSNLFELFANILIEFSGGPSSNYYVTNVFVLAP